MIAFYHPDSLVIMHLVIEASDEYMEWALNPATQHEYPFVQINERIPMEELEILPGGSWRRRVPMQVLAPTAIRVGETGYVTGVPEGAEVWVNNSLAGQMDASGELELAPTVGGTYLVVLKASGYITKELTIEAQPNS